jgi:hypothetical protein
MSVLRGEWVPIVGMSDFSHLETLSMNVCGNFYNSNVFTEIHAHMYMCYQIRSSFPELFQTTKNKVRISLSVLIRM